MLHLRHLGAPSLVSFLALALALPLAAACEDRFEPDGSTSTGSGGGGTCDLAALAFETGDENGHADPFGAKAAGQARVGRVQASAVAQPAHGRQGIEDGDFVLVNDKIAVFIEQKDLSDGYARFGGEILAIDQVGDDGKPLGKSYFMESIPLLSLFQVDPDSITVMNDGSNGEAAVLRVVGSLKDLPFLESFAGAFSQVYRDMPAAYEYVLEPGAEKIAFRVGLINTTDYPMDVGIDREGTDEFVGFFQGSFSELVTPESGYAKPTGVASFVGFDAGEWSFAYTGADGAPLEFGGLEISGFSLFTNEGFLVEPCSRFLETRFEIVAGGPHYDGLGEAVRRANGQPAWEAVSGTVRDDEGEPIAAAYVHAISTSGAVLSRTRSDATGAYTIHVPPGQDAVVVPTLAGYPEHAGVEVDGAASGVDLTFAPHGTIHVVATESGPGTAIPVRIQVLPATAPTPRPEAWGVPSEANGRLHQVFDMDGDATLVVPPGEHRVIVSRGPEFELLDTTVTVTAGATQEIAAALVHSVDTTDVLCGDFHIHTHWSADSSDPREYKVRSAVADGLEVAVATEHEWIGEYDTVIDDLGIGAWVFGVPSLELTTFVWGHFNIVPVLPKRDQLNNGAFDWLGKMPQEVFDTVHALPERPAIIVNHPSGGGFSSYFSQAKLDRATGSSTDPLWSDHFEAVEVFNDSGLDANRDESVADWFALLNSGRPTWAVGSSDSHGLRTSPVGYPRTCMAVGTDDPSELTLDDVRDAISEGRSTIMGGLYITVEGPGGSGPGSTVPRGNGQVSFTVTVQAPSWLDAAELEVIVNGVSTTEDLLPVGNGPGKRWVNQVDVTLPGSGLGWVVFHARGVGDMAPVHPGRSAFAVSNPILFE